MKVKRAVALCAATVVVVWCALGGLASAAFPNFSDCPPIPGGGACIDVQSTGGELVIKGFHVPLNHSLEIRGGLEEVSNFLIPPVGTTGLFAEPVNVPGGLIGLELPIGLNMVTATAELAGPPSSSINVEGFRLSMPLKLHLSNPLLASSCYIGSNRNPVNVVLRQGTTNPPPPNRPISGHPGTPTFIPPDVFTLTGNLNVDNSFAIPGATGCGLLGLNDLAIDLKLGLPSAAGNNTLTVNNDIGLKQVLP